MSKYTNIHDFEKILKYKFKDISLLNKALRHKSLGPVNYERFEFFGDTILQFIITEYLFSLKSSIDEDIATRTRAQVVNRDNLQKVAKQLEVAKFIQVANNEAATGLKSRQSINADCLEAIIAAIYLDTNRDLNATT
jgi:ribonuclease-3